MLTAKELEQRLLGFTRDRLADPEVADTITVDTRLFEDRVIDSLKVLELIAYLQSILGRKIPDTQIVLANFRSIATIARVFTGESPVATTRTQARTPNRHPKKASAVTELLARGELELTPDGALVIRGPAASLRDYFDDTVRGWALEFGATEETFPASIPISTLERAGFISAFPDKLVQAGEPSDGIAAPPAVCYHNYPRFADSTIGEESIVTEVGRCYRNEYQAYSSDPVERLRSFTMREIIAVGGAKLIERLRSEMMERVTLWVKELALEGQIEIATDPFFTAESRGRILMQRILPLKYELRLRVGAGGRSVAAASFNNHEQHFGRAFSIRLPSGRFAHSGCVAFGWERWIIAFVNQHGADEDNWPEIVRSRYVAATV